MEHSDPTVRAAADLAEQLAQHLDQNPAYERYGKLVSDAWGSGQWLRYTDADGEVHFLRLVVEPFRPPG